MPIIHHHAAIKLLVAVRGHPFDRTAFDAMFQAMPGISATMVDQPAAARLMNCTGMRDFDALVLYDMPGIDFQSAGDRPQVIDPQQEFKDGLQALFEQGTGVGALHHALAGWPSWSTYGEWLGGRFLYQPHDVCGTPCLDSGYLSKVTYTAHVLGSHPVTAGLPASFQLTDELYMAEIFSDDVTPLLAAEYEFTRDRFWSAQAACRGQPETRDNWDHRPTSNVIGWTKWARNSPLVYLQPGDGPSAYASMHYRQLVENAIRWVVAAKLS